MEIIVHQAILHVLDTTLDAPVLSGSCMEMTAEKTAYLQYHIEKLLASDDIRQCRPLPDSAFRYELEQNKDFIDLSCRIAGVLFDYMHAHTTIPGADLAVVDFTRDGQPWLGILKLNYKNGYTHYTESVDGAPVNSIIQQRACLPTQSGKVEEGALVDLTDYSMKLLEKKFDIDGHKEFYLSTVVFQYTTAEPEKKKLQAIQDAAVQAVQENYQDEPHVEAQVAMLIANQAADNDNKVTVEQVRRQLAEEYPLAAVPFDDYVEKSDVLEPAQAQQPVTVSPARTASGSSASHPSPAARRVRMSLLAMGSACTGANRMRAPVGSSRRAFACSSGASPTLRLVTTRWARRRISCQRCQPSKLSSISLPMARYSCAPG